MLTTLFCRRNSNALPARRLSFVAPSATVVSRMITDTALSFRGSLRCHVSARCTGPRSRRRAACACACGSACRHTGTVARTPATVAFAVEVESRVEAQGEATALLAPAPELAERVQLEELVKPAVAHLVEAG